MSSDAPVSQPARGSATDVQQFMTDLYGGVFEQKVGMALSAVAAGVVEHSRKGKVTLTFELSRIGESQQVSVAHTVVMDAPTLRGNRTDKDRTETPMHVNRGGKLSQFPENQHQMFDGAGTSTRKEGQPQ